MQDVRVRERTKEWHEQRPSRETLRTPIREWMVQCLIEMHAPFVKQPSQRWEPRMRSTKHDKPVIALGVRYDTMLAAAKAHGIYSNEVRKNIEEKVDGWRWG